MKEINVEKIMTEIRKDIKKKYGEEEISFESIREQVEVKSTFDVAAFREELFHANNNYANAFYFEVGGGIKGKIKKMIRKMVSFLGIPLVTHQNDYNAMLVRMFNQMNNYINDQDEQIKNLERVIEGMEEKIARMNNK